MGQPVCMRPGALPQSFPPVFSVSDALVAGATPPRLRRSDLDRSVWGARSQHPIRSLPERCALFATRLKSEAFYSHVTAILLRGTPLPLLLERSEILDVAHAAPDSAPHARGIRGHSLAVLPGDITEVGGLRCTSAARTWCDLGAVLSLPDLVAVGDFLIHRTAPLCSIADLREAAHRMFGRRGAKRLRLALELLNDGAESRPESHLRVILTQAGFAGFEVNHVLVDAETGRQRRPDFLFVEQKLILEYQGDYHRTQKQWRKDMTRRARLEAQGWRVMELNADDLRDPAELIARIRAILARA